MSLVTQLSEKCPTCGKVAKQKSSQELLTKYGTSYLITLECNHIILTKSVKANDYAHFYWNLNPSLPNCFHQWNINECTSCGAYRAFPFQVEGAHLVEKNNFRFLIEDEQGLGKTIQHLMVLAKNSDKLFPFLWLTKAKVKYQHGKLIINLCGTNAIAQPLNSSKDILWPNMNYITSYVTFRNLSPEMFIEAGVKTLILDECQAISNSNAIQTKAVRRLASSIPYVLAMSGTPWKNRASEYFNILNILDPKLFYNKEMFVRQYVDSYIGYGGKTTEGGIIDPEGFRKITSHIKVRRERKDVMSQLPPTNRTKTICEVEESARKAYNNELKKFQQITRDSIIDGTENSLETIRQQNETFMMMKHIVGISKIPTTVELVEEFLEETDRKLCIFTHHIDVSEIMHDQLSKYGKEYGIEVLRLHSGLNSFDSEKVKMQFINNKNARVLILSTLGGGEGIDGLQHVCSDLIMHERQWNPANEQQAEDRLNRIGQKSPSINARYMHADDTVDIDLDIIVSEKARNFHNSMNKGKMLIWNEDNIRQLLIDRLMKKKVN